MGAAWVCTVHGDDEDQGSADNDGDEEVDASPCFVRVDRYQVYHQLPLPPATVENLAHVKRVTTRSERPVSTLHPLQDDNFLWPSMKAEGVGQRQFYSDAPYVAHEDELVWLNGKLWISR
ncbi:hypothetical protein L914_12859 [Phytophthora nicotianae]|uniref:Uncharacterized protein n=2 Tax=Phytophthora nicotianae TaxID=4792 RepID=V9DTH0_PHYNI|nr:hypothetical protein F443_22727 [Phytophthora nicotianae P1569]ETM41357.1 hypothetical protein L914_12859 [Phytophthora nicotianae]